MLHDSLNYRVNIYVMPKNMLHMLYSHNTLKRISVQNRKEETAMNSWESSACAICIFPESHTAWSGWEGRRGTACVCCSVGNLIRRALVALQDWHLEFNVNCLSLSFTFWMICSGLWHCLCSVHSLKQSLSYFMLYRKKCEEIQHEEGRESNTSINGGKTEWWPHNGHWGRIQGRKRRAPPNPTTPCADSCKAQEDRENHGRIGIYLSRQSACLLPICTPSFTPPSHLPPFTTSQSHVGVNETWLYGSGTQEKSLLARRKPQSKNPPGRPTKSP